MGPALPPQNRPRLLSPETLELVRQLWSAGVCRDEICRRAGITLHSLEARRLDQLRDLGRRPKGQLSRRRGDAVSVVEIRLATHELRQRWPEERWLGKLPAGEEPLGLEGGVAIAGPW